MQLPLRRRPGVEQQIARLLRAIAHLMVEREELEGAESCASEAQLLAARGERDEAIRVLRRGRGALMELGQDQAAAQASEPLATVGPGQA